MTTRKLWLVEWLEWDGYDVYISFVGCFETEAEARATHPRGEWDDYNEDEWINRKNIANLRVTLLGVAYLETPSGIIESSFRHG